MERRRLVLLAVVTPLAACAVNPPLQEDDRSLIVASSLTSVPRDRLEKMTYLSAYDALPLIPGFARRVRKSENPHYNLWLDGTFTTEIEILKLVRASEVREMRMIGENRTLVDDGTIELVVRTFSAATHLAPPDARQPTGQQESASPKRVVRTGSAGPPASRDAPSPRALAERRRYRDTHRLGAQMTVQ